MGLCKCPKKNVTTQFCYEHRVNVCEYCMVSDHSGCIVQSYISWLKDSEYDPTCQICKTKLEGGEFVRLICYHVFHWDCLNKYASELFPHTAPAGYTCPICKECLFPPSNLVSPVADALRNKLLGVSWARCGLAFPIIEETATESVQCNNSEASPRKLALSHNAGHSNINANAGGFYTKKQVHSHSSDVMRTARPEPYGAAFNSESYAAPRKMYDSSYDGLPRNTATDHDEDKYKRRSAFEWFGRWFHSKTYLSGTRRRDPNIFYKKWVVIGMLTFIALCTVVILFLRMGRASADTDPLLDPHLNPNIRVQDSVDGLVNVDAHAANSLEQNVNDGVGHIRPR